MEISQQKLKEIILRVLKELELEDISKTSELKKIVYMICLPMWSELYIEFLNEMEKYSNVLVYPVIPKEYEENGYKEKLISFKSCHKVILNEKFCFKNLEKANIVFPLISLDIISKTALCISDTFENKLISTCIYSNSNIVFMIKGIPKLSGKEPLAYVNQILEYYRKVLSFGIKINNDCNFLLEDKKIDKAIVDLNINNSYITSTQKEKKNIITISNMDKFIINNTIKINDGDIITDLVKDKAEELNISIIYK